MELYKREIGYEDLGRDQNLVVTATTLYIPIFLTQSFEDIGIYTDTDNQKFDVIDFGGNWDLSDDGLSLKECKILNNCLTQITETPISFFNGNDGGISVNVTNCPTPYTFLWTGPNGFTSTNPTISNLFSGNYTLKITDGDCDITYVSYFLQQPQPLSFNTTTVNSQTNAINGCTGSASVTIQGGKPPYQIEWLSGSPLTVFTTNVTGITNLCSGLYTVKITDSDNNIVSSIFNITEPQPLSGNVVSTLNVLCSGGNTGKIKVQGIGGYVPTGYTYTLTGPVTISNTTGEFNNLPSGTYSVTIYDNANISFVLNNITLTTPNPITYPTPVFNNVSCYNGSNGSVVVSNISGGQPPYTVQLLDSTNTVVTQLIANSPSSVVTFNNLSINLYTVKIIDNLGCVSPSYTQLMTQPFEITATFSKTPIGGGNYSVNASVSGGQPLYDYSWNSSPVQTSNPAILTAGMWQLTVTDSNGCIKTFNVNVP
jgi:hypothetical protein